MMDASAVELAQALHSRKFVYHAGSEEQLPGIELQTTFADDCESN